jgi:hypothetical protein
VLHLFSESPPSYSYHQPTQGEVNLMYYVGIPSVRYSVGMKAKT